jgi:hypothetical protein
MLKNDWEEKKNGKPTLLLKDNTDLFKEQIEEAFEKSINDYVITYLKKDEGIDIPRASSGLINSASIKFKEEFLSPMTLKSPFELVKTMGGIVGDAKLKEIGEIKFLSGRIAKEFKLITDKYELIRGYNLQAKEIISNDSFTKTTDEVNYGASVLNNQINHTSQLGFKYLTTDAEKANNLNGYYTWLMMGYIPRSQVGFDDKFKTIINNTKFKNVDSYLELLATEEGRDFWKKNGFAFNGVFDLSEDSFSRQIFNKYIETRKIVKSDVAQETEEFHTNEELNGIYSQFTLEDLNNAYQKWQEHEDWKAEQVDEFEENLNF